MMLPDHDTTLPLFGLTAPAADTTHCEATVLCKVRPLSEVCSEIDGKTHDKFSKPNIKRQAVTVPMQPRDDRDDDAARLT